MMMLFKYERLLYSIILYNMIYNAIALYTCESVLPMMGNPSDNGIPCFIAKNTCCCILHELHTAIATKLPNEI